jgi:poly-gamma-glutamate capsule biosynthesis protein CapA/YwtB (metallophosphatase superfamily)
VRDEAAETARRLQVAAETAIAEKNMLEGSLAKVREDRTRIQRQVSSLTKAAETALARDARQAEDLRARIDDVAIEVARVTAMLEGPDSRIDQILAAVPATGGRRRRVADLPLADRIRAALDASRGKQAAE